MSETDPDHRIRLYSVRDKDVLNVLNCGGHHDFVRVMQPINLPPGARIVGVQHDLRYMGFVLAVYHESFENVPPGAMAPVASEEMAFEVVELRRAELPLPRPVTVQDMKHEIDRLLQAMRDAGEPAYIA